MYWVNFLGGVDVIVECFVLGVMWVVIVYFGDICDCDCKFISE